MTLARRAGFVLLLSASMTGATVAQAQRDIVVTGHGLAEAAGAEAYDVIALPRERILQSASGRLEDILRDAAGFQQFRRSDGRSAHPTSQGATLRGLGGNASSRALILLDGVPQGDPFGGWISFPAFDPDRLGLIRVTRGGGAGAAGPGALAGTIELVSADPDQLAPAWGRAAYGSRDSAEADLGLSARLGGGFASLSGGYARGDGFVPIVKRQRGAVDRAAPYEQWNIAARGAAPLGSDVELQANALLFGDERDRGTDFTANRTRGTDLSLRLVGRGTWGWEAAAWLQLRDFDSEFASINASRSTVSQTLDQRVPATGSGARFELRPPVSSSVELRLGGDIRQTHGRTNELFTYVAGAATRVRVAGGSTRTAGAFAEATVQPSGALTVTGGARIDRWWIERGFLREVQIGGPGLTDSRFADRAGTRPTGRVAVAWKPAGAVTLRSAGYLGWRLPTLNELYRPFRAGADATAANAGLDPERLRGIEAGIDFRPLTTLRFGGTLFWNRLAGAIANVTVANGPGTFPGVGFVSAAGVYRRRDNLDAIRSRGLELDGEAAIGTWRLVASMAFTDARVRASGTAAALDGLRPAQTPKYHASATLGWQPIRGPRGALTVRYVGRQYEDDQNLRRLEDALTLDAFAAVPLVQGLTAELRGENLLGARVEAGVSGTGVLERATPRTLWLGLRYSGR